MGRFIQRRFRTYSELGAFNQSEPAINDLSYVASPGKTLADVQAAGFWAWNAAWSFNQPFAANCAVDPYGFLICSNPAFWQFGEYYDETLGYTAQIVAKRIQQSEIVIEYSYAGGIQAAAGHFILTTGNPLVPASLNTLYAFDILCDAVPTNTLSEVRVPLGAVGAAFTDERDCISNKIKISAVRTNANRKTITINWWSRALAAMQTAVLVHNGAGVGDIPHMWYMQTDNNFQINVKSIRTSSSAISYGDPPV